MYLYLYKIVCLFIKIDEKFVNQISYDNHIYLTFFINYIIKISEFSKYIDK